MEMINYIAVEITNLRRFVYFTLCFDFLQRKFVSVIHDHLGCAFLTTVQIKTYLNNFSPPEVYSEPSQRSKQELFVKIVNGFLFSEKTS